MPVVPISSHDDPRIAIYRDLKPTNATRTLPQFVVEGEKLLDRLLASRYPLVSVAATERRVAALSAKIDPDIPLFVMSLAVMERVVGFNFHQGVLGCGARLTEPAIDALFADLRPRSTVLICPWLSNPENLGSLARIADVFDLDAILVGPSCPDPLSRRVLRVSMGASLRLPILRMSDPIEAVETLRSEHRFRLVATVAEPNAIPVAVYDRPERVALVLGNETHGLGEEWLRLCDDQITIPMRPGADSLNVAVSAAIMLDHLVKEGRG